MTIMLLLILDIDQFWVELEGRTLFLLFLETKSEIMVKIEVLVLFILVTLGQKNFRGVEVQIFEVISCWENLQLELINQVESTSAPFVHVFDYFESAFCPICLLCET